MVFVSACNFPNPMLETLAPTSQPGPTPTSTTEPTPAPTPVPTDLVWYAPNMGSRDYADLFMKPEQWSAARSRINILKFYTQNVLEYPCVICGDDTLRAFVTVDAFRKLTEWGIAIGVEVGAVKPWGCTGTEEFRVIKEVIGNIQVHGGRVAYLDMDEPYIGGELVADGMACGLSMEQSAGVTAQVVENVNKLYPEIMVGDTEPYPYFSVAELEQWILALETRGVTLAHFHLDVDVERVQVDREDVVGDLQQLSQFFQEHRIPFGVIFTSNWHAAGSDRAYFDSTLEWVRTVNNAIGKPPHVIFQSWQADPDDRENKRLHKVPINLPENDPSVFSHTRLILEGLGLFGR